MNFIQLHLDRTYDATIVTIQLQISNNSNNKVHLEFMEIP